MEDKEIVKLYWDRDERAIKETSAKYGRYCYKVAINILMNKEDADESVNDTWLKTWECIPPHFPEVLATFVGKITRRISLNMWHSKNRLHSVRARQNQCFLEQGKSCEAVWKRRDICHE